MVEGVKSANVDVSKGLATVESEAELDLDHIEEEIEDMGYDFLGVEA